jgi:hypothetical protein
MLAQRSCFGISANISRFGKSSVGSVYSTRAILPTATARFFGIAAHSAPHMMRAARIHVARTAASVRFLTSNAQKKKNKQQQQHHPNQQKQAPPQQTPPQQQSHQHAPKSPHDNAASPASGSTQPTASASQPSGNENISSNIGTNLNAGAKAFLGTVPETGEPLTRELAHRLIATHLLQSVAHGRQAPTSADKQGSVRVELCFFDFTVCAICRTGCLACVLMVLAKVGRCHFLSMCDHSYLVFCRVPIDLPTHVRFSRRRQTRLSPPNRFRSLRFRTQRPRLCSCFCPSGDRYVRVFCACACMRIASSSSVILCVCGLSFVSNILCYSMRIVFCISTPLVRVESFPNRSRNVSFRNVIVSVPQVANRDAIYREYQFKDFQAAFHFMTRVGVYAEAVRAFINQFIDFVVVCSNMIEARMFGVCAAFVVRLFPRKRHGNGNPDSRVASV